jgi:hypothetical protein
MALEPFTPLMRDAIAVWQERTKPDDYFWPYQVFKTDDVRELALYIEFKYMVMRGYLRVGFGRMPKVGGGDPLLPWVREELSRGDGSADE